MNTGDEDRALACPVTSTMKALLVYIAVISRERNGRRMQGRAVGCDLTCIRTSPSIGGGQPDIGASAATGQFHINGQIALPE